MSRKSAKIIEENFLAIKQLADITGISQQKLLDMAVSEFIERVSKTGSINIGVPQLTFAEDKGIYEVKELSREELENDFPAIDTDN